MAVDLAKLVSTTEDFQKAQLDVFSQFVDDSKALISTLDGVQKKADEQFKAMDEQVQSLVDAPTSGSDEAPIAMLKYDELYLAKMAPVVVDQQETEKTVEQLTAKPKTTEFCQYIDDKASQFVEHMDKRQSSEWVMMPAAKARLNWFRPI